MEQWLTQTIPGIILLGAAGSLLSLFVLWVFKIAPVPIQWHKKRQSKQAFSLGFSAAVIDRDETGRRLMTLMAYHLALIVLYAVAFLFSVLIFIGAITMRSQIIISWASFLSSASAFTILYLLYFEFDFVRRTYLFHWRRALESIEEAYDGEREDLEN